MADAQALAEWMTPELIAADKKLDIMSGAAGAILGLLSLYEVTKDATVLKGDRLWAAFTFSPS